MLAVIAMSCSPVEIASEDEVAFDHAFAVYNGRNDYPEAIRLLSAFIRDYPYSEKIDNSQLYLGKAYMKHADQLADPSTQIAMLREATNAFEAIDSRSPQYVEALYRLAESLEERLLLGDASVTTAMVIEAYEVVSRKYPSSEYAAEAGAQAARLRQG
jgi:TolA-binding protein